MVLLVLVDFIHSTQIKIDKECEVEGRGSEKSKMAVNLSVVSGVHSSAGRYFIYDYYYVPKHNYYILLYIIIITL